jgi:hypothetical protein
MSDFEKVSERCEEKDSTTIEYETFDDSCIHIWLGAEAPSWAREELRNAPEARFIAFVPARLRAELPPPHALFPRGSCIVELGDASHLIAFDSWPVRLF